jgi:hypothetical protein
MTNTREIGVVMRRMINQVPGLRILVEKMAANVAADPQFQRRYLASEIDLDGRLIPRSPATVTRLKHAKLQTGRFGYLGRRADEPTASHVGGHPAPCAPFEWPTWKGRELTFVAQIDFADLHNRDQFAWLPASGTLLFFVGQNEWGEYSSTNSRVIHISSAEQLMLPPDELPARLYVSFDRRITYSPLGPEDDAGQVNDDRELDDWYYGMRSAGSLPVWQLGGWPNPLQTADMRQECERRHRGLARDDFAPQNTTCFRQALDTWHLLGQFDVEGVVPPPTEFMRGFFWVKVENNEALFDQCILVGQSD